MRNAHPIASRPSPKQAEQALSLLGDGAIAVDTPVDFGRTLALTERRGFSGRRIEGAAELSQHRKVVHIHIPKCGGTAVTRYLRRLLGRENVAHFGHRAQTSEFRALAPEALDRYLAVGGHIPFSMLREKLGPEPMYFAIVREPFDLYVSFYRDVTCRAEHPLHQTSQEMSATDFVEFVAKRNLLRPQYFYLSEGGSLEEAESNIRSGEIRAESLPRMRRIMVEVANNFERDPIVMPRANASKKFGLKDKRNIRAAINHFFAADKQMFKCVLDVSRDLAQGNDRKPAK